MVENFKNKKVTIMGLGLHGGGLASALFFLQRGAKVTITDLRTKEKLEPTLQQLKDYNITYTLGEHIDSDFTDADIVIKNPGVRSNSKYLKLAKRVESDISIFLSEVECPIIAITGSKGKSSTVSAIYYVLAQVDSSSRLGGNITVSPLTFVNEINTTSPVILELSSWQLADLKNKNCFKPQISAITNIMNDHQNAYGSLEEYADDKSVIFNNNTQDIILNYNDNFTPYFKKKLNKKPLYFSNKELPKNVNCAYLDSLKQGWVQLEGKQELILNNKLSIKGEHQRENLLLAALVLYRFGVDKDIIKKHLSEFTGIKHRMEMFLEKNGVKYYNDSAATIPEAVVAAISSFKKPVRLICGGTDKELDFNCVRKAFKTPKSIHLLEGSGTDKLIKILKEENISYFGPYNSLENLVKELDKSIIPGDNVLFSPGATSFGMFNNEFHRGDQFKKIVLSI